MYGRDESGWGSDVSFAHKAWRHARVRFLLPDGEMYQGGLPRLFMSMPPKAKMYQTRLVHNYTPLLKYIFSPGVISLQTLPDFDPNRIQLNPISPKQASHGRPTLGHGHTETN